MFENAFDLYHFNEIHVTFVFAVEKSWIRKLIENIIGITFNIEDCDSTQFAADRNKLCVLISIQINMLGYNIARIKVNLSIEALCIGLNRK